MQDSGCSRHAAVWLPIVRALAILNESLFQPLLQGALENSLLTAKTLTYAGAPQI